MKLVQFTTYMFTKSEHISCDVTEYSFKPMVPPYALMPNYSSVVPDQRTIQRCIFWHDNSSTDIANVK